MKNYTEKELHSLIARFEAKVLPKVEWTHEAHLAVAIWYCSTYDFTTAKNLVRKYISAHNVAVGTGNTDEDGYHETITLCWLIIAKQFLTSVPNMTVINACNTFINNDISNSEFLLNYYSKALLFSVDARHYWKEPDLKPL